MAAADEGAVLFGGVPLVAANDHEGCGGLPGSQGRMVIPQQSPAPPARYETMKSGRMRFAVTLAVLSNPKAQQQPVDRQLKTTFEHPSAPSESSASGVVQGLTTFRASSLAPCIPWSCLRGPIAPGLILISLSHVP